MGLARAVGRTVALLALTAVLLALWPPAGRRLRPALRRLWCRGVLAILGVRVSVERAPPAAGPAAGRPTLFVANHLSYLDIPVLGAALDVTFVAKAEVAGWPLIGRLARLAGTMFVRRHWRQALVQRRELAERLDAGGSLLLFPEGTSGDGLGVLPVKSSLLSVAEDRLPRRRPVAVQAVTLAHLRLADGTPVDAGTCDLYAWYGDADLLPHLWRVLGLPGLEVGLRIGAPIPCDDVPCRKRLARDLEVTFRRELARQRLRAAAPAAVEEPDEADAPAAGLQEAW